MQQMCSGPERSGERKKGKSTNGVNPNRETLRQTAAQLGKVFLKAHPTIGGKYEDATRQCFVRNVVVSKQIAKR